MMNSPGQLRVPLLLCSSGSFHMRRIHMVFPTGENLFPIIPRCLDILSSPQQRSFNRALSGSELTSWCSHLISSLLPVSCTHILFVSPLIVSAFSFGPKAPDEPQGRSTRILLLIIIIIIIIYRILA